MRLFTPLLCSWFAACACQGSDHLEDIEVTESKADGDSSVTAIALGSRYELSIDSGTFAAMWLSLGAGESAGLVVRGQDGFNPYAVARAEERILASRGEQTLLAHIGSSDIVVSITGPQKIALVAGGPSFETGGVAFVDVVAFDAAPASGLDGSGSGHRAIHRAAKDFESQRVDFADHGALAETDNGILEVDVKAVSLSERSELNRVAISINDLRQQLFQRIDPTQPERAGRNVAQLIAATSD